LADSTISDLAEKLREYPGSTEMQALLFQSALKYLEQLTKSSGNDPHLLLKLSKAYERVGDLEGSPGSANLGKVQTTVTSYREALRAATEAHASLPGEESRKAVLEICERLGSLEFFLGNIQKAHYYYQQALAFARAFWKEKPYDPVRKNLLAMSYAHLGDLELDNLETVAAMESYRAAFQAFGNDQNGNEDHDKRVSALHIRMAGVLNELGSQAEALVNLQKSLAISEDLAKRAAGRQSDEDLFSAYTYMSGPLIGTETLNVADSQRAQFYARKALAMAERLAARDSKNVRGRYELSFAYEEMGDSFRWTQPSIAGRWYRKSILLTREVAQFYPAGSQLHQGIAERDEKLAAVLIGTNEKIERLHVLEEANGAWQELVRATPARPQVRMSLMRSYCKLTDAELSLNDLVDAKRYAGLSLPLLKEFKPDSPSLLVLREIGFCDESLGNLQRRLAMDRSLSHGERHSAAVSSREWYRKSLDVWSAWSRRGAATPESELERRKLERLLEIRP
jgi:tetratricopeptide (TPR) repeat protein